MAATRDPLIRTEVDRRMGIGPPLVAAVVAGAGLFMLVFGVWSFVWPETFAAFVLFPYHRHFLHDLGAFQIGIGATLLISLWWRDAISAALAGFAVGTGMHAVSHVIDISLGGRPTDWIFFVILALVAVAALVARRRWLDSRSVAPPASPVGQPPKIGVRMRETD